MPFNNSFITKLSTLVIMMAVFSIRRGTVAAFGIASISTSSRNAVVASKASFGLSASRSRLTNTPRSISALRLSSSATMAPSTIDLEKTLQIEHSAYEVVQRDVVNEYGAYCTLFRHKKSGAELLSVSSEDDNKVFGITFRTPPEDSTGVPHILEHSVLCGSRKYKTKDPFVHLLKGSLQTFLNAFTYPDRTCYVVASQNEKDFYNLCNVYADAVFHPRAIKDPMVLAQEGWHLELENKDDPLTYKGVVYNEMKGVYSSPDSLLMRAAQRSIFPDNTYSVDSGGDPKVIPELSFNQFAEFHHRFYHPSNARIYFSGDDDVHKRLEFMDAYLSDFDASPQYAEKSEIEWQSKTFTEPKREVQAYPAGADQPETHMLMVNWLLNEKPFTATEELTLGVLDHLLMGTTSSILRKTLMESGLGDAITGGGLSDELLQATFSVGLKGVQPDKVDNVETLVVETLAKAAKEGFSEEDIASSMNTIEFQMREFNTGSFPKGLSIMLGTMSKWLYGRSPTDALKFEEPLAELKAKIAESGSQVFTDMMQDLIIKNTHRTTIELKPSKTLEEEIVQDELKRLETIKSQLSDTDLEHIMQTTSDLKALQSAEDSPESTATIPSLKLSDLKRESTEYPIEVSKNENGSGITVVRHSLGSTSGIAYVSLAVDLSVLTLEEVSLLPIFTRAMTETGAGDYDSVQLSRKIGTHTGGVGVTDMITALHVDGVPEDVASSGENMQTKLIVKGKATTEKIDELFDIFQLILTEARFDSKQKIVEMLRESRSRMESRIQGSGHSMASARMKARYRVGAFVEELMGGITYLDTVKNLLTEAEEDWPSLLAKLERMREKILDPSICRSGMILDITGDQQVLDGIQPSVKKLLNELPGESSGKAFPDFQKEVHPWVAPAKKMMAEMMPVTDEGFIVPTQVSYVGKSGMLYDVGEKIPGSAAVVARFLRTGYLWDYVRVMGGAYGGFCQFSPFSGFFAFLSYRDPNLDKTLDIYDAAAEALDAAADAMEVNPEALETAIIGTIGDMDGSLSPDQKGSTAFQRWLINESPEYRQKYRDEILATTTGDFREFAQRLRNLKSPSIAVVSSKAKFEEAAKAGKTMALKEVF
jgi:Zn-dependent M16 (insulinase) family peptidase